jgi:serralysin
LLRRTPPATLALLAAMALTAGMGTAFGGSPPPSAAAVQSSETSPAPPGSDAGPPYDYVTVLNGQFHLVPLQDKGMLTRTKHGYRYRSGGQSSHLVITVVPDGLRFVDTGTKSFKSLTSACSRSKVKVGVAAVCQIPASASISKPVLIEIWPRLGNDYTDTSSLPASFAVTVLADVGNDVAHLGAGPDFFNGAKGRDQVWGGGGNDWIRSGPGNDLVRGGDGNDYIVAQEGHDRAHGGDGDDRVEGGDQNDRLWGDAGADFLLCGTGDDTAVVDEADRIFHDCETVDR